MKRIVFSVSVSILLIFFIMTMGLIGCKAEKVTTTAAEETVQETSGQTTAETSAPVTEETKKDIFAGPTELTFWWYGEEDSPGFTKYVEATCAAYNELHPNITVTPVHQASDVVVPNFLAAAEAKSGPDIATVWYGIYNFEQVWAGNVAPISDYVDQEELSHWIGNSLAEYDGKIWSSDLYDFSFVILYYKDHFKDAGLDPEKPPVTWDEFMDASKKLKAAGHDPFAAGFSSGWMFPLLSYYIYPQYLTFDQIKECVAGERHFDDPEFVEVWKKIAEYAQAGYFLKSAASIDFVDSWFEWRSGNATICPLPSATAITWIEELGTDKVGIMNFPQLTDKPVDWVPVAPVAEFITSWSPNKELAADFLVYMHTEESMNRMVDVMDGKCFPPDDRFDVNKIGNPLKRQIAELTYSGFKNGTFFTDAVIPYAPMGEGMIPVGQLLILGDLSPEDAATQMEAATEEWRKLNPEVLETYKIWAGIK